MRKRRRGWFVSAASLLCGFALAGGRVDAARPAATTPPRLEKAAPAPPRLPLLDDSFVPAPAHDLALQPEGDRKAEALARFVEGLQFEENGETEKALASFQKVLNVDPSQVELATRVAYLLTRQEDYPRAIDVLKDAVKAQPRDPAPYLQLAFIYAKHLKKTDQAAKYANQAITLEPGNIEAYQRLFDIYLAANDPKKAQQALDRALTVENKEAAFWIRLGKLYASLVLKPEAAPSPQDLGPLNSIFRKAIDLAGNDAATLKEAADYYAASQQVQEAIPLYLKVLELQPGDSNAREKLATGFLMTNQRAKALEMLQEVIKTSPEKYQTYELLARLLEENAEALEKAGHHEEANSDYAKAAANYEQSLLINSKQAMISLRLAQVLLAHVKNSERAVQVLTEARARFTDAPEITYYLALALREAKRPQLALTTFEEALHEAEQSAGEIVNGRFYVDYGTTAEQAGLYDKAADLFQKAIVLDPTNAADAYNALAFMWAEHSLHLDDAAEMIGRALQIDPTNGAYLDTLGWVDYRRGKFEPALEELQRAARNLHRDDPVIFEHIGDACFKLNRIAQALDFWQKSAVLDPENKKLVEKMDATKTKLSKGEPLNANQIQ